MGGSDVTHPKVCNNALWSLGEVVKAAGPAVVGVVPLLIPKIQALFGDTTTMQRRCGSSHCAGSLDTRLATPPRVAIYVTGVLSQWRHHCFLSSVFFLSKEF